MRGEIIVIGDELVLGKTPDINGSYAARRLTLSGFGVMGITVVGDEPTCIESALRTAIERSDFTIITGGLGPTSDDITTEVAANTLGRPLVFNQDILRRVEACLRDQGEPVNDYHQKLARLPEGAEVIDRLRHICGFFVIHGEKPLFFLPGIPEQMRIMLDNHVIPDLLERAPERVYVEEGTVKVFGLGETRINEICRGIEEPQNGVSIGFLPKFPENHISISVRGRDLDHVRDKLRNTRKIIMERLGAYVFGVDNETLEVVTGRLLRSKRLTLAIAESCTGGLIGHRITNVSGSSDYLERGLVVYSNRSKMELLNVPQELLENYGAVSQEVAEWMAKGIRTASRTDIGLGITGIAGPTGGTERKPVGTVFISISTSKATVGKRFKFSGTREEIKLVASETAIDWLRRYLIDDTVLFGY